MHQKCKNIKMIIKKICVENHSIEYEIGDSFEERIITLITNEFSFFRLHSDEKVLADVYGVELVIYA